MRHMKTYEVGPIVLLSGQTTQVSLETCGLLHFVASVQVTDSTKPTTGVVSFGPCLVLSGSFTNVLPGNGFANGGNITGTELKVDDSTTAPNQVGYAVPFYGQCPDRWLSIVNSTDRSLSILIHYNVEFIDVQEK